MGLVGDHYTDPATLAKLPGFISIGHTRYSTTGEVALRNVQPLFAELEVGGIAVAHNGNFTNGLTLRRQLIADGAICQSTSDTEVVLHLIARSKQASSSDRFIDAIRQMEGGYSMLAMTRTKLIAARDPIGIRPLVMGELDGKPIFCSETCALDIIGAKYIRDVENGEVVICEIQPDGSITIDARKPEAPKPERLCLFEFVYFARPDSVVGGRSIYVARKNMGINLAKEAPVDADVVVPVPDGGTPAALGYAQQSGIPFEYGIIRNHYVGRTFIEPTQQIRAFGVKLKHSANRAMIRRQARRPRRRFDRARHHLAEDRPDDPRRRREGSPYPRRKPDDLFPGLLWHRYAGRRQAACQPVQQPEGYVRITSARILSNSSRSTGFIVRSAGKIATTRIRSSPTTISPATTRRACSTRKARATCASSP